MVRHVAISGVVCNERISPEYNLKNIILCFYFQLSLKIKAKGLLVHIPQLEPEVVAVEFAGEIIKFTSLESNKDETPEFALSFFSSASRLSDSFFALAN